jgi:hypothetical protein
MTANLNNDTVNVINGKDSIVIIDNFQSIRGGRTLDTTGFPDDVIQAGHVIIEETSSKNMKPMPVVGSGSIESIGQLAGGSSYTNNGTYTDVALTGGSGSGAKATIVVAGNAVTSVTITTKGTGYKDGDVLSAAAADIGTTGTGFKITATSVGTTATSYDSLPSGHTYAGILIASIPTDKPFAGIMVRGTVNVNATPFSMTSILSAVKAALPLIIFTSDKA